jgi:hypothetical protein
MTIEMVNYLTVLIYLVFMAQISLTWRFHYLLLYHLSFGVLFIIALLIALSFAIGFYLKSSKNIALQTIGKGYELLFSYTAPMQGVLYTTLVFFIVGSVINLELPIIDFEKKFMFDWLYGTNYATWIIYGLGFTFPLFIFQSNTQLGYFLATLIGLLSWGLAIAFFFFEQEMHLLYEQYAQLMIWSHIFIQIFLSLASMYVMLHQKNEKKSKKKQKLL